jgi:hypothetical protein
MFKTECGWKGRINISNREIGCLKCDQGRSG